jgi:hypothetical protein
MRPDSEVTEVFRLRSHGLSQAEIARQVGISRATVRDWLSVGESGVLARPMRTRQACDPDQFRCPRTIDLDEPAFAYLLGQYLGDGCVSRVGRSFRMRIFCCDQYPGIKCEVAEMMRRTIPGVKVGYIQRVGCTELYTTSIHWPCLVPHGPGRKHLRQIVLEDWQREIVLEREPARLVRGLIHSDGCRCINRIRRGDRVYEYPRYLFSNKSADIQALFLEACQRLDVEARHNNRWSISVARRASVARLDELVGPKS